jgi:hypothetical protein
MRQSTIYLQSTTAPGAVAFLGRTPEGQRQLGAILNAELAVLYFPFRQTTPSRTRSRGASMLSARANEQCIGKAVC